MRISDCKRLERPDDMPRQREHDIVYTAHYINSIQLIYITLIQKRYDQGTLLEKSLQYYYKNSPVISKVFYLRTPNGLH